MLCASFIFMIQSQKDTMKIYKIVKFGKWNPVISEAG